MRLATTSALPFACLCLTLTACSKPASQTQPTSPNSSSAAASAAQAGPDVDARTLLTQEEVAAVQGCAFTGVQGGGDSQGEFRVSQCVYIAAEPNKSVSLVLMGSKPAEAAGKGRTVKQFWRETFARFADGKKEKDGEPAATAKTTKGEDNAGKSSDKADNDDDELKPPPVRIKELGDDAYWGGSHVGSTLYVLKGETLLRISVGGTDNDETRLAKSKTLAAKALGRL